MKKKSDNPKRNKRAKPKAAKRSKPRSKVRAAVGRGMKIKVNKRGSAIGSKASLYDAYIDVPGGKDVYLGEVMANTQEAAKRKAASFVKREIG